MSVLLDILFIGIIAFCAWRGYKSGAIVAICGIIAIIISLFIANAVANKFSHEFDGMLAPFASGIVDSVVREVVYGTEDGSEESLDIILTSEEKKDVELVSKTVMMQIGVSESASARIAAETAAEVTNVGQLMSNKLTDELCGKISFTAVFSIVFVLVFIIFAFIENLVSIYIEIPKMHRINRIAGAVAGGIKGILLIMFFACLFRYACIIVPTDMVDSTIIVDALAEHNIIANMTEI